MQFSARRDLREKMFRAFVARGAGGGAHDNAAIMRETVALRAERARLLGFPSFAAFRLADSMAKTPQAALDLMRRVWAPARAQALREAEALQAMIAAEGGNFRAQALGLALLRREAPQGALRRRPERGQRPICRWKG